VSFPRYSTYNPSGVEWLGEMPGHWEVIGLGTTEAERAIALLQERRAALISAAVTGQIDVRSLAPEVTA
jgi:hypothetical protein